MAERYRWTPQMVNALPVGFVDELSAYWSGEEAHRTTLERRARARKGTG